ncbi:unnamed protein product [Pleuronectes platessa]|uniref:Uncharacterized protein n=1 Tax=Pleuronectes platessa TaxID=8262 RepID=A0A9N7U881_PLEPL|nr:unnamed protein product [Pleuronectes platessa]
MGIFYGEVGGGGGNKVASKYPHGGTAQPHSLTATTRSPAAASLLSLPPFSSIIRALSCPERGYDDWIKDDMDDQQTSEGL